MRLCFHFETFNADVSSGTVHAAHQWHELCMAFGISEAYVINTSGIEFPQVNESVTFTEIDDPSQAPGHLVGLEKGDYPNHRGYRVPDDATICIGGSGGLHDLDAEYITIPTVVALYPREAAAIVLEEQWQLRL